MSSLQSKTGQCSEILPTALPPVRRIIAIGDVHGDYRVLIQCLQLARVVNDKERWIGGDTVVVQLGDQIDSRCRADFCEADDRGDELRIVYYLDRLHREAQVAGGGVYSILGNHEIMNINGDFSYASGVGVASFDGEKSRQDRFRPGGDLATYLACHRNVVLRIGSFLFVHGGLVRATAKQYSLEDINRIVREYMLGTRGRSREVEDLIDGSGSPLWSRRYTRDGGDRNCSELVETLDGLQLAGMVVGHTVQSKGINSSCNDRLWKTDVALSRSFGTAEGNPRKPKKIQVLEILNDGKQINVLA